MRGPPQLGQKPRPFPGERQQPLERAVAATNPGEAMGQHAAAEEFQNALVTNVGSPTPSVRSRTVAANSPQCPRTIL
jgi:hypothetical protein